MRNGALVVLLVSSIACGGGGAKAPPRMEADAGATTDAGLAVTPPPSGLPPMASMPPPGVAGSQKAKLRPNAALSACAVRPAAKDPSEAVKRLGEACAPASKMKPASAMFRGRQGDADAHEEHRFRAEANRCYRVYAAAEDTVKELVVVLRDSAGDVVAEAPAPAAPDDGAACFTTADEVTLLVGVGSGKGAWAAQVWSD